MTREKWAKAFLRRIDAPRSKRNITAVVCWIQAEGGDARWNPLNSTHAAPGATEYNWVGVKNYPTFEVGVRVTAETLNYGADRNLYGYRKIRRRLRKNARSKRTLRAIEKSTWGTGGLALEVLPWVKRDRDHYLQMTISGS